MFKENITAKREVKQIRQLEKIQTALTCKVETDEEAKKIISHFCKIIPGNFEVLEGQVVVNGDLSCNLVYINADDCFDKAHGIVSFSDKIEDNSINIDSSVGTCKMNVISCKIANVSGKEVRVEAIVEIEMEIINNEIIELSGENLDDVFIKTDSTDVKLLKQKTTESFCAELSVKTKEDIKDVLFSKSRANIKSVEVKNGYIIVNGEINSKIVYLTNEEEPKLKVAQDCATFSEEIKTDVENPEACVDVRIDIKDETSEIKEKEALLRVEMIVTILAFENDTITSILDAYCVSKEVNMSYASCYNETLNCKETFNESISSRISLKSSELSRIKLIDCVEKSILITSVIPEESYLTIDGVATYNVLFEELPEDLVTSQVNSVEAELPFSIKVRKEIAENSKAKVNITFKDSNVFQAKNSEAEISSNLNIDVSVYDVDNVAYVNAISFGEEKQTNTASLSLYITKEGDDIWSISKSLNVDPEILAAQNTQLMDEALPAGEQIVLYRQKTRVKAAD